jgi:hypothetical protein
MNSNLHQLILEPTVVANVHLYLTYCYVTKII